MLLYHHSKSPSQHDISTSISDHLRHISRLDPLLFSPLYSILIDCCVGCTPIPPQYLPVPPFPTCILLPHEKTHLMIGVVSRHIISTISFISCNTTIRDCLYDSCLCICRRRSDDIDFWRHNHYCIVSNSTHSIATTWNLGYVYVHTQFCRKGLLTV